MHRAPVYHGSSPLATMNTPQVFFLLVKVGTTCCHHVINPDPQHELLGGPFKEFTTEPEPRASSGLVGSHFGTYLGCVNF